MTTCIRFEATSRALRLMPSSACVLASSVGAGDYVSGR